MTNCVTGEKIMNKIFNTSHITMLNVIFNVPQNITMVICLSLFQGITDPVAIAATFIRAYGIGFAIGTILRLDNIGDAAASLFNAKPGTTAHYIASNIAGGALMGVLMNGAITFMALGPVAAFWPAYIHTVIPAILVSAAAQCVWMKPSDLLAGKIADK